MYVIIMIMIEMGQHKVASNQVLYPNMEMCEVARTNMVSRLMASRPSEDAHLFSKCTEISFDEHKAGLAL